MILGHLDAESEADALSKTLLLLVEFLLLFEAGKANVAHALDGLDLGVGPSVDTLLLCLGRSLVGLVLGRGGVVQRLLALLQSCVVGVADAVLRFEFFLPDLSRGLGGLGVVFLGLGGFLDGSGGLVVGVTGKVERERLIAEDLDGRLVGLDHLLDGKGDAALADDVEHVVEVLELAGGKVHDAGDLPELLRQCPQHGRLSADAGECTEHVEVFALGHLNVERARPFAHHDLRGLVELAPAGFDDAVEVRDAERHDLLPQTRPGGLLNLFGKEGCLRREHSARRLCVDADRYPHGQAGGLHQLVDSTLDGARLYPAGLHLDRVPEQKSARRTGVHGLNLGDDGGVLVVERGQLLGRGGRLLPYLIDPSSAHGGGENLRPADHLLLSGLDLVKMLLVGDVSDPSSRDSSTNQIEGAERPHRGVGHQGHPA